MVSGAQEDKCINCAFWSMWEGECMCVMSTYFLRPVSSDKAACKYFEREKDVHDLHGRKSNAGIYKRCNHRHG